jgi:germination protein M
MKKIKRENLYKKGIYIAMICLFTILSVACGANQEQEAQTELAVFYISKDYTTIVKSEYYTDTKASETEILLDELFVQMSLVTNDLNLNMPLNSLVQINQYILTEEQLVIDFSDPYLRLESFDEILVRAAIVQTVTGLEGVDSVFFTVGGNPIVDSSEQVIGRMDANTFINSAETQINSFEKTAVQIYFANEEGTKLFPVDRTLVYSSNISMERLIVNQIIDGPANEDSFATIHPNTRVNSVIVQDGVCYVDLSEDFLNQIENVSAEVAIYSLVNSLVEVNTTNKVQISIDGYTRDMYLGEISLDTVFTRNLEVIER